MVYHLATNSRGINFEISKEEWEIYHNQDFLEVRLSLHKMENELH